MSGDLLKIRKEKIIKVLKDFKEDFGFLGLVILIIASFKVRTSNLPNLIDITTGKYIPGDPDAAAFFRYAKYILDNGKLMDIDLMRYFPLGYSNLQDFSFLSHFIVYLYKFIHFFDSSVTFEYVGVIFPAITFGIALIFFYLLVRKLFDFRVALLASAFLSFMPPFLYRTISGVGDKEALGIAFFFAALYFYVLSIKSEHKYGYLHGITSGLFTALLGAVWGGVNFVFLIIGITLILKVILNNLSKKEYYSYACWWFSTFLLLRNFYISYYSFKAILISFTSQVTLIALGGGFIFLLIKEYNFFNLRERFNLDKYPVGILSIFLLTIFGLVSFPLFFSVFLYKGDFNFFLNYFYTKLLSLLSYLIKPFQQDIFMQTVLENKSLYLNEWAALLGIFFFLASLGATILLFYQMFKDLKKRKWSFVFYYIVFLTVFFVSKFSANSILDGKSFFSRALFFGGIFSFLILFFSFFIYSFFRDKKQCREIRETTKKDDEDYNRELEKDKQLYNVFTKLNFSNLFLLVWFFVIAFAARDLIRLVFIFVPIASIFVAIFLINVYDFYFKTEDKLAKFFCFLIIFMLVFAPFAEGSLIERTRTSIEEVDAFWPAFNHQWQLAMKFVRENTPKDSVFAHWWDYGYWIQAFGERATLSDGGNARGEINSLIARQVFMGQDRKDALELLKTHNATHLLISEETGKYFAISRIGSNETSGVPSYMPVFLAEQAVKDKENENGELILRYFYNGNFDLDEDLIAGGKFFPKEISAVKGVVLSVKTKDNNIQALGQPIIVILLNGEFVEIPLNCVFFNGREYLYHKEDGYEGCLRIIPTIDGDDKKNSLGAGLFLSPNTRNTLLTQIYLFDKDENFYEEWKGFKKIYDDSSRGFGYAFYPSYDKLVGPTKIYSLTYNEDIKTNPTYLRTGVDY